MSSEKLHKRISILQNAIGDLENRYEDKVHELSLLRQVGDVLGYVYDLREASHKIVNLMFDEMSPDCCSLMLYNAHDNILELQAVQSGTHFDSTKQNDISTIGTRFKMGECAAGWSLEHGKVIYINDTDLDERFCKFPDTQVDIKTLICVPLLSQNKPEGVLNISFTQKKDIPKEKINFLNIFMQHAGLVIGNIRLFHTLSETNKTLKDTNENLKNTFAELHKTQKLIIQSEKLAGLGLLAGGIAHEFNNIFAAIMGYSELALISDNISETKKRWGTSSIYRNVPQRLLTIFLIFPVPIHLREWKPISTKNLIPLYR